MLMGVAHGYATLNKNSDGAYEITSAEDWKELMTSSIYWSNKFVQTANIDLTGLTVTPVGNSSNYFKGTYDGQGYTISNVTIYWDGNSTSNGFGLFGAVNGDSNKAVIKNLNLDNVTLTCQYDKVDGSNTKNHDFYLGILVGALGQNTEIKNIRIINSKITNGETTHEHGAIFAGGLIGGIAQTPFGTGGVNSVLTIKNIYSNVDFDLQKTTSNNCQAYVGGIMGRGRRISDKKYMPDNVVFSGTINAPCFIVGPIYSVVRDGSSNNNNYTDNKKMYSGENSSGWIWGTESEENLASINSTRLFYNYQVYNPLNSVVEEIKDTYPEYDSDKHYRYTRTFAKNNYSDGTFSFNNATDMAAFQGVNIGGYIAEEDKINKFKELSESWNSIIMDEACRWTNDLTLVPVTINYELSDKELTAKAVNLKNGTWSWKYSEDGNTWNDLTDSNGDKITNNPITIRPLVYYYAIYSDAEGVNFTTTEKITINGSQVIYKDVEVDVTRSGAVLTPQIYDIMDKTTPLTGYNGSWQWQKSTDGGTNWSNISGATASTYTITDFSAIYRVQWKYIGLTFNSDAIAAPYLTASRTENIITATITDLITGENVTNGILEWYKGDSTEAIGDATTNVYEISDFEVNYTVVWKETDDSGNETGLKEEVTLKKPYYVLTFTFDDSGSSPKLTANLVDGQSGNEWTGNWTWYTMGTGDTDWVLVEGVTTKTLTDVKLASQYKAVWTSSSGVAHIETEIFSLSFEITSTRQDNDIEVKLQETHTQKDYTASSTWQWQRASASNAADSDWEEIGGATSNKFKIPSSGQNYYYRAVAIGPDGKTYVSQVFGPIRMIYIYDRPGTIDFQNSDKGKLYIESDLSVITKFDTDTYDVDGDDSYDGTTPLTPVKTFKRAYELLEASEEYNCDQNKIVVMGFVNDQVFLKYTNHSLYYPTTGTDDYNKCATITGTDNASISGGIIVMGSQGEIAGVRGTSQQAPLVFENIVWYEKCDSAFAHYCNNHDFKIGNNVYVYNFKSVEKSMGLPGDITTLPYITIVGGRVNYNAASAVDYSRCTTNQTPGLTKISLNSGCFARVMGGGRNNQRNDNTHNITGSDEAPHRVLVEISIDGIANPAAEYTVDTNSDIEYDQNSISGLSIAKYKTDQTESQNYSKYGLFLSNGGCNRYTHDIGLFAGGQTDGTIYAETELVVAKGYIARFIGGNIAYGRNMNSSSAVYPDDSYFGSVKMSIYDGAYFNEVFGSSLGRHGDTSTTGSSQCDAFFYGKATINWYGGSILKYEGPNKSVRGSLKEVETNLYGCGAGAIMGAALIDPTDTYGTAQIATIIDRDGTEVKTFTEDSCIPYIDASGSVAYAGFTEDSANSNTYSLPGVMPTMTLRDGTELSLAKSEIEINIMGGNIAGNVYGGGFGYSNNIDVAKAREEVGYVYGNTYVNMTGGTVKGSLYGASAGSSQYVNKSYQVDKKDTDGNVIKDTNGNNVKETIGIGTHHKKVACQFGDATTVISGGTIMKNVYGGAMGIEGYSEMATLYGNAYLTITKSKDQAGVASIPEIKGDVYGGSALGNIRKINNWGGNTYLTIEEGVFGNCIFGGSQGENPDNKDNNYETANPVIIDGSCTTKISGGSFTSNSDELYIVYIDGNPKHKNFNIYGGGYRKCTVNGNTYLDITQSLLKSENSLDYENLKTSEGYDTFKDAWDDLTHRRFCVYGGGYGENAPVKGDSYVNINVDKEIIDANGEASFPVGPDDEVEFYAGRQFFDVAGGGYTGSVRNAHLTIDGNAYVRKVIGGGFYGGVKTADTKIVSGLVFTAYGGCLLGYVFDKATMTIGTRAGVDGVTLEEAAKKNSTLWILDHVYGANDVQGIVGVKVSSDPNKFSDITDPSNLGNYDASVLYQAEVDDKDKGVFLNIYGGEIRGCVYGAGNGHYKGYYVPGWARYYDGPERFYRTVPAIDYNKNKDDETSKKFDHVYKTRPQVGRVNIDIRGNSETDRVTITERFFGGGRGTTIGQWQPELQVEDPRRLVGGGHLAVNFGSHVTINGGVHMGSRGTILGSQQVLPDSMTLDGKKQPMDMAKFFERYPGGDDEDKRPSTADLNSIGNAAYYHWYWDNDSATYKLGFPAPGDMHENPVGTVKGQNPLDPDKSYFFTGEHQFYGYLKFIEMNTDVKLSFYSDPFDEDGIRRDPFYKIVKTKDENGNIIDKEELRSASDYVSTNLSEFDATDIRFGNFFLGGERGFMTYENTKLNYDYDIVLPSGVTIEDKVVCGSEDSWITYYPYTNDKCQKIDESNGYYYNLKGGLNVQSSFSEKSYTQEDIKEIAQAGGTIPALATTTDGDKVYADIKPGKRDGAYGIRLACNAAFDPQLGENAYDKDGNLLDETMRYGGLIYGGCYNSGVINGDVVLYVGSNLLGNSGLYDDDETNYNTLSSLKYNVGRVFGGGYGPKSTVEGDTHVYLIRDFRGFNVFGGGQQGDVEGMTNVHYFGTDDSHVYGSIYGGGIRGNVGYKYTVDTNKNVIRESSMYSTNPEAKIAQFSSIVALASGNVNQVFGGACLGDMYGSTAVELVDEISFELENFKIDEFLKSDPEWQLSHLVVGTVYGGNDIAGTIFYDDKAVDAENRPLATTNLWIHEIQGADKRNNDHECPGYHDGYSGFPLVGTAFGGSCGNYGDFEWHQGEDGESDITKKRYVYKSGEIYLANGTSTNYDKIDLGNYLVNNRQAGRPDVESSQLRVAGGTVINAYGGGDMASVGNILDRTGWTRIVVEYKDTTARAGFWEANDADRLWKQMKMSSKTHHSEVMGTRESDGAALFRYQIANLYGGNDNADLPIQPIWELKKGVIGNLYSGCNVGRMTYYNDAATLQDDETRGIQLTINSKDLHIMAAYGGGRIGDIDAGAYTYDEATDDLVFKRKEFATGEYGATINVKAGIVEAVYGGNDVAGVVYNGTNVNITGAISGDVYGAGNGNYKYFYDQKGTYLYDSTKNKYSNEVAEIWDESRGGKYYVLPNLSLRSDLNYGANAYGGTSPSAGQTLMAINHYRPNVEKAYLHIEGTEDSHVYVKGNVYCGGNSSTVANLTESEHSIKFDIGNYVTLNGVFLGSNGESLSLGDSMLALETLNSSTDSSDGLVTLDLSLANDLAEGSLWTGASDYEKEVFDKDLFPTLLDVYMHAVDVENTPDDFKFDENLKEAYIGEFCIGGNHGSMLTDEPIDLTFPEALVIYKRIVGGCYNANTEYKGVTHIGGMTKPLAAGKGYDKVRFHVKCQFQPKFLKYPYAVNEPPILLHNYLVDADGNSILDETTLNDADGAKILAGKEYYVDNGQCNIYGGCYSSGRTVGNVFVDIFSDMLKGVKGIKDNAGNPVDGYLAVVNGIDKKEERSFCVVGGGFGSATEVYGHTRVRMLPGKASPTYVAGTSDEHPSAATVFGGSQDGLVVGNTTVELRDGKILTNLYGGSETHLLYGSSQVIVGYPKYYRCNVMGEYELERADDFSDISLANTQNDNQDKSYVVPKSICYRRGDIVPMNVYEMIKDEDKASKFVLLDRTDPKSYILNDDEILMTDCVADTSWTYPWDAPTWDDIDISVGDQGSITDPNATYYGYGCIYGGGHVSNKNFTTMVGSNTVVKFTDEHKPMKFAADMPDDVLDAKGYGGNSSVIIWDNPNNAAWDASSQKYRYRTIHEKDSRSETDANGAKIKDRVSVGTGRMVEQSVVPDVTDVTEYYKYDKAKDEYLLVPSGKAEAETKYYNMETEGGIYGSGRKVFVEGFRAVDIAYYGYAEHTPQKPKLLPALHRADVATFTDCCAEMFGAQDFTTLGKAGSEYSINRVGELQMVSSLAYHPSTALVKGEEDSENKQMLVHDKYRCRNFLGLFRNVHYMAALKSNVKFDDNYHNQDGEYVESDDYINHKHHIINKYYDDNTTNLADFQKRNVATAANMIGITNDQRLRVQGVIEQGAKENSYYGPIVGVVEVKMLTLAMGQGGGFIYALNQHLTDENKEKLTWCQGLTEQDFLHVTGNFVFPGAKFLLTQGDPDYNYMLDDCEPYTKGYDTYKSEWEAAQSRNDGFNVNDAQEVHYWYVNGQNFFYDVTVTGITSDSEDQPMNFYIDEEDDDYRTFPGLTSTSELAIESVVWNLHPKRDDDFDCDITKDSKVYTLRLTLDNDTEIDSEVKDGKEVFSSQTAYVVELPRSNSYPKLEDDETEVKPEVKQEYVYATGDVINVPNLGIWLIDAVNNSGRAYYKEHLEDDHKVDIVVSASDTDSQGTTTTFTYTIRLTIHYILGPTVTGYPVIENCALPGEYIYANADNVVVEMDDNALGVTATEWFLHPYVNGKVNYDEEYKVNDENKIADSNSIHIPALYHYDDWKLGYRVYVNHEAMPDILVKDEAGDEVFKSLKIHNYHRMKPYYTKNGEKYILDWINFTTDARVYIENDEDMAYFMEYLMMHQNDNSTVSDATGKTLNPHYCEDVDFYLMSDVELKLADWQDIVSRHADIYNSLSETDSDGDRLITFRGNFHGLGHTIKLGPNMKKLLLNNQGNFYDTGFEAENDNFDRVMLTTKGKKVDANGNAVNDADGKAITYTGAMRNCFFFNRKKDAQDYGKSGALTRYNTDAVLENCYQNTLEECHTNASGSTSGSTYDAGELFGMNSEMFYIGLVAYNLNGHYLKKRKALIDEAYKDKVDFNNPNNLNAIDKEKWSITDFHAYYDMPNETKYYYMQDIFNSGDYRYAKYETDFRYSQALRTYEVPNYEDYLGKWRDGECVTHHDVTTSIDGIAGEHPRDEIRWDSTSEVYRPIFGNHDYIFFGQYLTKEYDTEDNIPERFFQDGSVDNRVYRASGFYGSKKDHGFYFNPDVYASSFVLTAIDFEGYRDNEYIKNNKKMYDFASEDFDHNWIDTADQAIYYPPTMDMPFDQVDSEGRIVLNSLEVGPEVTHNLLIYGRESAPNLKQFHYSGLSSSSSLSNRDLALHSEDGIVAHHIVYEAKTGEEPRVADDLFHLVDKHNFDAPIAFTAGQAWYNRQPKGWADGTTDKSAWEGICLPFTAHDVYAASTNPYATSKWDHGISTHFYGDDYKLHEYWLRRFEKKDGDKLIFGRPTLDNLKGNVTDSISATYAYSNSYFLDTYGENTIFNDNYPSYTIDHSAYGSYDENGVFQSATNFEKYRHLTARIPYIVTFPSKRYYEFDMSGEFFFEHIAGAGSQAYPQTISYQASNIKIPVTTDNAPVSDYTDGGYTVKGTFVTLSANGQRAPLIEYDSDDASVQGTYFAGSSSDSDKIYPFRVYVEQPVNSTKALYISSRGAEEELAPGDDEEDGDDAFGELRIWAEGAELVVDSPYEESFHLTVFNVKGQAVRVIEVNEGENRYRGFSPGFYLIHTTKLMLSK